MKNMQYPSFTRRCIALFYDWLLIFSLCIAATSLAIFFTHGQAITADNLLFKFYLFLVIAGYYVWFLLHGGQTSGMRAWKIKLISQDNTPVTLRQTIIRIILAIPSYALLIGFLWQFFDSKKQTLHDKLCNTLLILDK